MLLRIRNGRGTTPIRISDERPHVRRARLRQPANRDVRPSKSSGSRRAVFHVYTPTAGLTPLVVHFRGCLITEGTVEAMRRFVSVDASANVCVSSTTVCS